MRSSGAIACARRSASCNSEGPPSNEQYCLGITAPLAVVVSPCSLRPSPAASTTAQVCSFDMAILSRRGIDFVQCCLGMRVHQMVMSPNRHPRPPPPPPLPTDPPPAAPPSKPQLPFPNTHHTHPHQPFPLKSTKINPIPHPPPLPPLIASSPPPSPTPTSTPPHPQYKSPQDTPPITPTPSPQSTPPHPTPCNSNPPTFIKQHIPLIPHKPPPSINHSPKFRREPHPPPPTDPPPPSHPPPPPTNPPPPPPPPPTPQPSPPPPPPPPPHTTPFLTTPSPLLTSPPREFKQLLHCRCVQLMDMTFRYEPSP